MPFAAPMPLAVLGTAIVVAALLLGGNAVAPHHLGSVEDVRTTVYPTAGLDTDLYWKDHPDFVYGCELPAFEEQLAATGFTRNPVAHLVYVDGEPGASWGYRDHLLATYQLHPTVVGVNGSTHVYVHREWNTFRHPLKHYREPGGPFDLQPDGPERFEQLMTSTPAPTTGCHVEYSVLD